MNFSKINESLFLEFLRSSPNLRSFHIERVDLSSQFIRLLSAISSSETLQELKIASIPITIEYRLERLQNMFKKAYNLKKVILQKNKLVNLNFLSLIYQNKTLLELELINQNFTKEGKQDDDANSNRDELEES